jgi:predicted nucleic acid-binding protein
VGEALAEDHPNIDLKLMLDYVIRNAEVYAASPLPEAICEDPANDKFLSCAQESESTMIVSGDKHLLKL